MEPAVTEKHQYDDQYILCDHCDLVVEIPRITNEHSADCPRCGSRLVRYRKSANTQALIYSLCAIVMFLFASGFQLISIRILGNASSMGLYMIPDMLLGDNYPSLSLMFTAFVLVFPLLALVIIVLLMSGLPLPKKVQIFLLVSIERLQSWCMAEIFLAGLLVSFVKLTSYGDIGLQNSFIPYCLFILLQIRAVSLFEPRDLWKNVAPTIHVLTPFAAGKTGLSQNIRLCQCCHAMLPINKVQCPRCYVNGYARQKMSIEWTISLLLTSIVLYIPANSFAVMSTVFVGSMSGSTILDGVIFMWQDGDYPVALIIFIASVVIPVLKIIALLWLCYFSLQTARSDETACLRMTKVYNIVEFIGRWSMIDIFVVAVTAVMIRNGELMTIYPDLGAVFFASVVIITMLAAHRYDPRLIWDKIKRYE